MLDVDEATFDLMEGHGSCSSEFDVEATSAFEAMEIESTDKLVQRVECDFVLPLEPRIFCVLSESFPWWILALDRNLVTRLIIVGAASSREYLEHLRSLGDSAGMVNAAIARIGLPRVTFSASFPREVAGVCLMSGSSEFLNSNRLIRYCPTRIIGLVDEPFVKVPRTCRLSSGWHERTFRHLSFGGPTNTRCVMGFVGLPVPSSSTALRRTIDHVFEYGIRPAFLSDPSRAPTKSLRLSDTLDIRALQLPVVHTTLQYSSGWGIRPLTPVELGIAFGLPSWLQCHASLSFFPCPPLQILDGVLRATSRQLAVVAELATPTPRALSVPTCSTWLPTIKCYLPHEWADQSLVSSKAVKGDDATVASFMWDQRILPVFPKARLDIWRGLLLRRLRRALSFEFRCYLADTHGADWAARLARVRSLCAQAYSRESGGQKDVQDFLYSTKELQRDAEVGLDVLIKFANSDWFEWTQGSTLVFWRWPAGYPRRAARDGMYAWIQASLPRYDRKTRPPKPEDVQLLAPKFSKLIRRGYIIPPMVPVRSLTDYFYVPKGADDVRVVYNGTSCGLNDALWAPSFWLPTPKSALRVLDFNYYSVDIDLGEYFLNFPLPRILRAVSGIDLSSILHALPETNMAVQAWDRCWFGMRPSPFFTVRFYYWAEEFARGDRNARSNSLRWDRVILNLPGDPAFDPTRPWVMKWDDTFNRLAGDILAFIDDLRASGATLEQAWQVARQIASRLQYLGIQDAARKRRPSSQTPGAWAGALFKSKGDRIIKTVSAEKWKKAQTQIDELLQECDGNQDHLFSYKRLEQIRGFLCHLGMTFEIIFPYLKGFHLTLASHLSNRDTTGWKLSKAALGKRKNEVDTEELANREMEEEDLVSQIIWNKYEAERRDEQSPTDQDSSAGRSKSGENPPARIKAVAFFYICLDVLKSFFETDEPPEVNVRSNRVYTLLFGFHDASGSGLGSSVLGPEGIRRRVGIWASDMDESSNFREFENGVQTLEDEAKEGRLDNAMVFLCTDNSTTEAGWYKGNSSSKKLFDLIVRLRKLQIKHSAKIYLSHVSGDRMKAQGTDGFSRGHMREGVALGLSMLEFIPFNVSAIDRTPGLRPWLLSWMGQETEVLTPEGWFTRGHDHVESLGSSDEKGFWQHSFQTGTFLWVPPPAAANVALEELRKARIKRQNSTHFFVVPRLMAPEWRKQLHKTADLIIQVPPGTEGWPAAMYEPLTIAFVFPFLMHAPWQYRGSPKMFNLERQVRRMYKEEVVAPGAFLCELLLECRRISSLPADVVWSLLHFTPRSSVPRAQAGHKRARERSDTSDQRHMGKKSKPSQRFP